MARKQTLSVATKGVRRRKILAWVFFQVLIPYLFVVGCWPLASFANVNYPLERAFVGADLILLGSMLFLAIVIEIHIEQSQREALKNVAWLDWYWYLTFALSIVFLVVFVALKRESIVRDFPSAALIGPPVQLDSTIKLCVLMSLAGGILAFFWSIAAGLHTNLMYLRAELAELKIARK